jgi:anti-sigma regulatory factor (Ser/Thr protein kinase)/serine/threonine protein phosphatase PrpC
VDSLGQAIKAQDLARACAREAGFPEVAVEAIALVVHELATNLVRHARGGTIELMPAEDAWRQGIQILSLDEGPGIPDPEQAMVDGYSTLGGLGNGLGTVHRLMDDLEFSPRAGGGTRILCRRWIRASSAGTQPCPLVFGAASRPRRNEKANGDAFLIKTWQHHALCGVIDGLGHGEPAQHAAQVARCYLEDHPELDLDPLFQGTGRVTRSTRGVVMALARFDLEEGVMSLASIGNIEARLVGDAYPGPVVRRGIVGLNAPKPVVTRHPWGAGSILVLHSDGLHSGWSWRDFPDRVWEDPGTAAHRLLEAFGKDEDDVTVLIVKGHGDD